MGFKNTLSSYVSSRSGNNSGAGTSGYSFFGRVVDIILDEDHPMYSQMGGAISINGVFVKPLERNIEDKVKEDLPFAFQTSAHIKTVPILGEIVEVTNMPNPAFTESERRNKRYYTRIVNIWNNANSSVYLDVKSNPDVDISTGGRFKELPTVNPTRSTPGDVQIEGRQGQSIRFTGGKGSGNPWVDDENIGSPVIVISNGQSATEDGFSTLAENVDEDDCSIYLTSNHSIPLTPASEKRATFTEEPEKSDQFKGNQIILNAGRLYLNAKQSDIQLSSISAIGMNTEGSINLDASSYFCLDAPIVYLGERARTASDTTREAVLLGNQTENFLQTLLNMMEGMANDMAKAKTVESKPIPLLNKRGIQMKPVIRALKRQLNPQGPSVLKSKKVFTE